MKFVFTFLICLVVPLFAFSQSNDHLDMVAVELMGKLCVNEASWSTRDCAAITHIRVRSARSHGRTLRDELIALHGRRSLRADRATRVDRRDNRPWIAQLNTLGTQPALWPDTMNWPEHGRSGWGRVLSVVVAVLEGKQVDPCRGTPNTWGNRGGDHVRALRLGFRQVDCGSTANMFWRM